MIARRTIKWVIGIPLLLLVLFAAFLWVPEPPSPGPQFAWIPPASGFPSKRVGARIAIKYKILRWLGPLGRRFRPQPNVSVETWLFSGDGPPGELERIVGSPISTNTDGARAWILSTNELFAIRQSHPLGPAFWGSVDTATVTTADDTTIICQTSSSFIFYLASSVVRRSIHLQFSAWKGNWPQPVAGGVYAALMRTNPAVSWDATVPNRGAVLIAAGSPGTGSNFWMLVTPTRIDAKGKPLP